MGYEKEIELKMQCLFATLSKKDRRCYAGIEAVKLGHDGIEYILKLFNLWTNLSRCEISRRDGHGDTD